MFTRIKDIKGYVGKVKCSLTKRFKKDKTREEVLWDNIVRLSNVRRRQRRWQTIKRHSYSFIGIFVWACLIRLALSNPIVGLFMFLFFIFNITRRSL